MNRARHLKADPGAADGCLEWDPATRSWQPPLRQHLGDRLLIAFGIAVLLFFAAQGVRFLLQHGWL